VEIKKSSLNTIMDQTTMAEEIIKKLRQFLLTICDASGKKDRFARSVFTKCHDRSSV
jgi:hypothetical protein